MALKNSTDCDKSTCERLKCTQNAMRYFAQRVHPPLLSQRAAPAARTLRARPSGSHDRFGNLYHRRLCVRQDFFATEDGLGDVLRYSFARSQQLAEEGRVVNKIVPTYWSWKRLGRIQSVHVALRIHSPAQISESGSAADALKVLKQNDAESGTIRYWSETQRHERPHCVEFQC